MKKFMIVAALVFSAAVADLSAKKTVTITETPASDSRIEYIGRTMVEGGTVSYDWAGVYFRVRFTGSSLAVKCSDSKNSWFNLWVDKEMSPEADRKFMVAAKDTVIVLAEGLGKGEHEVILQKRTEGEQGRFTVQSFFTAGEILQASGRKDRHIEFVGDSYTCGYGTESGDKNDPFLAETENCNLTYAAITARYFGADFNLVSHSGQGVARNYDNYEPGYHLPHRYTQVFDTQKEPKWEPAMGAHTPDIVVVYLGTNDFSTSQQPHESLFRKNYIELLKHIKANYGEDIPILCMGSNADPFLYDYIRNSVNASGLKNVAFMSISKFAHNYEDELGASWHPNYKGHQKVASCMIPYISTLTGWKMTEQPYK